VLGDEPAREKAVVNFAPAAANLMSHMIA